MSSQDISNLISVANNLFYGTPGDDTIYGNSSVDHDRRDGRGMNTITSIIQEM